VAAASVARIAFSVVVFLRLATSARSVASASRAVDWSAMDAFRTLASSPTPGTTIELETESDTSLARPWKVIVHDDPITLMNYVVMVLRQVFGFAQEKAHRLMMEVHLNGRSVVWTGAREQAEMYVQKLHSHQLLATMEITEA
jgi:ATP-dependent Clp protease adaptor protein ClpS